MDSALKTEPEKASTALKMKLTRRLQLRSTRHPQKPLSDTGGSSIVVKLLVLVLAPLGIALIPTLALTLISLARLEATLNIAQPQGEAVFISQQLARLVTINLVAAGLLTVLAVAVTIRFGTLYIVRPIKGLIAGVNKITAGQFETITPDASGRDEIGLLSDAFYRMSVELQNRLTRERAFLESAIDCFITIDHQGQIIEFNPAAEKTFGYRRAQVLGRDMSELVVPSSWEGQVQRQMTHYFAVGHGTMIGRRFEVTARRAGGIEFPAELAFSAIRGSDGLPMFLAFVRDITARKQSETQINASLREKEVLLKETHHRVKNNLQVISSMLNMQSKRIRDRDARAAVEESQQRVRSMALIHEKLYQSDNLARIDLADYIQDLAQSLFDSYRTSAGGVDINIQAERIYLGIDIAVPCGLILNELISNALKHGFPPFLDRSSTWGRHTNGKGEIRIGLHRNGGSHMILEVGDNGVGLPAEFDWTQTSSLGLQLVSVLVDQLDGNVLLDRDAGTQFTITFPVSPSGG